MVTWWPDWAEPFYMPTKQSTRHGRKIFFWNWIEKVVFLEVGGLLFDKEQFSPTCKLFVRQRNINPETKYHVQLLGGASILSPWGFWEESKLNFSYFRTICISPLTCGINFECLKCNYKYSMVGDIPILKYIFMVSDYTMHVGFLMWAEF